MPKKNYNSQIAEIIQSSGIFLNRVKRPWFILLVIIIIGIFYLLGKYIIVQSKYHRDQLKLSQEQVKYNQQQLKTAQDVRDIILHQSDIENALLQQQKQQQKR